MRHFIIGTAGHVDHGKTSLIKAMTGIDADRLMEEKKRGITIDLGFAYMDLPHFHKVGIVDVPGHEKFIRNMLAGAGGIDLALLIVAADEGVMPQTREHLEILSMLNIHCGAVVITKTDLAEPDFIDLVEEEVAHAVEGTFLEHAPIMRVSSYTGEGLEELKACIDQLLMALDEKDIKKPFRLPVDRAFTVKGFGTVVTGTVIEGQISPDMDCMLYPDEIPVKIRGIQVHSENAERAYAGQRAAVNLANIKKEDIKRGYVLAPAGSLVPTMMLDVLLRVLKDSPFPVKNNSKVHLHHGSAELIAKVVLLDRDVLEQGDSCYAQLRLEEKISVKKGDRFVIRFYSPIETIGGGEILDAAPTKKKRNQAEVYHGMEVKEKGSDKDKLYQAVVENAREFLTLQELTKRADLNRQNLKNHCAALVKEGWMIEFPGEHYLPSAEEKKLRDYASRMLKQFHKENPLKEGMMLQEFRQKLLGNGKEQEADALRNLWQEKKVIKEKGGCISLYPFRVQKQEDDQKITEELSRLYHDAGFTLPVLESVNEQYADSKRYKMVMSLMLKEGTLIKLDDRYLIHKDWFEDAKQKLFLLGTEKQEITLGEYRDCLNASRKVALALLDYFDRLGITKKNGDIRTLFRTER